jgi:dTDP-4-dehydrorhamnose reductase
MTKVLVFGGGGFVGGHLVARAAADHTVAVVTASRQSGYRVDIRDSAAVETLVDEVRPDGVVNTAAISAIDYAEKNRDEAWAINALGAENVARVCGKRKTRHVFLSTDAVFPGDRPEGGYAEDDLPNPVNFYGQTKAEAEKRVGAANPEAVVVRVSLVLGFPVTPATGFLAGIDARWRSGEVVKATENEVRTPIDVVTLVEAVRELLDSTASGIYHLASTEAVSRLELTRRLAEALDYDPNLVQKADPGKFAPPQAPRHRYGVLKTGKAKETLRTPMLSLSDTVDRAIATGR